MIIIGLGCILAAAGMWAWSFVVRKRNSMRLEPRPEGEKVRPAILVPARDESAVIADLLNCLLRQSFTILPEDIYVIVESEDDPTVEICRKQGVGIVLRRNLALQRKGYALDDVVKEILAAEKHYDLYLVFDADNLLADDFVEKMVEVYRRGYQIATGQRMAKNGNVSVVAAASALTFAMINGVGNRYRLKNGANVVFSGTGLFVAGALVEKWSGWPFHSLTEDYELSMYATLEGLATTYERGAKFYDEQPVKCGETVLQRVRWIRGYFDVRREYVAKLRKLKSRDCENYGSVVKARVGVKPVILGIVGLIMISFGLALRAVSAGWGQGVLLVVLGLMGVIYFGLWILTVVTLKSEDLGLSRKMKWKILWFNPWYLLTYVPCAMKALLTKNVKWARIKHGAKSEEVN